MLLPWVALLQELLQEQVPPQEPLLQAVLQHAPPQRVVLQLQAQRELLRRAPLPQVAPSLQPARVRQQVPLRPVPLQWVLRQPQEHGPLQVYHRQGALPRKVPLLLLLLLLQPGVPLQGPLQQELGVLQRPLPLLALRELVLQQPLQQLVPQQRALPLGPLQRKLEVLQKLLLLAFRRQVLQQVLQQEPLPLLVLPLQVLRQQVVPQ